MRHALRVTRKAVFLFAVLTTAAVWSRLVTAQSAQAQSQDRQQEIQQLKDKLQQMDQMMGEVKAEIKALESQAPQPAPVSPPTQTRAGAKVPEQAEPVVAIPSEAISRPQIDPVPLEGEITEQKNSVSFYGF